MDGIYIPKQCSAGAAGTVYHTPNPKGTFLKIPEQLFNAPGAADIALHCLKFTMIFRKL